MKKWLSTLGSRDPAAVQAHLEDVRLRSVALKQEGSLFLEQGDLPSAIDRFERAIVVDPKYAEAHCNLGIALRLQGRLEDAARALQEALATNQDLDRAHYHLGSLYALGGQYDKAVTHLDRTLELDPAFMSCYHDLSVLHYTNGQKSLAHAVIDRGLAVDPNFESLHLSRGNLLIADGDIAGGTAAYEACLALFDADAGRFGPTFQMALINLYMVNRAEGNMPAADRYLAELLAKNPDDPAALNKLGEIYLQRGEPDMARQCLRHAFDHTPLDHDVLNNLGLAEYAIGNIDESMDFFRRAANVHRKWPIPVIHLAKAFEAKGDLTQAADCYQHALRLDPTSVEAIYRFGLLRLIDGDFQNGWRDYETRWSMPHMQSHRRSFPAPLWLGQESLLGKSILVHAEQGMGDTIHALRFIEQIATTGASVYLEVQPGLRALCAKMPSAPFTRAIISRGDSIPVVDFHCPLMSLPLALKMRDFVGLPGRKPYLRAPVDRQEHYAAVYAAARRRVGIAWSDDQASVHEADRSVPLSRLTPLMEDQSLDFFLLQAPRAEEVSSLSSRVNVRPAAPANASLAELAGAIANLDLVITADSTIAHLSASMGKPTWILIGVAPDWRWMLERTDSPWYPSAKLYRQSTQGDWDEPIARLAADLSSHFAETK